MSNFQRLFVVGSLFALTWVAHPGTANARATKKNPAPISGVSSPDPVPGMYVNAEGSPLLKLIEQTRSQLDIEIYEMDDADVRAAIRAALARHVRVRIVKDADPLGACKVFPKTESFGLSGPLSSAEGAESDLSARADSASCADQQKLVRDVNDAGGTYVPFNKAELCGGTKGESCFQHGKIALSDGKIALVSSGNFNATNLCDRDQSPKTCDRDYSEIVGDSDVVGALESIFERDLAGSSYDVGTLLNGSVAEKLTVSPLSLDPLVKFIESARVSIQLENQYLKEPTINAALVQAARNGVKVEVTVASACAFGKPSASEASEIRKAYGEFDAAGISSKMFNQSILIDGVPGYLHAKAIVVDGDRAWMGSVNGSTESVSRNREFGLFVNDAAAVKKLEGTIAADHSDPGEESWQQSLECAKDK